MIRRLAVFAFLFWLFWPRAWLPTWDQASAPVEPAETPEELQSAAPDQSPSQAAVLLLDRAQDAFPTGVALRDAGVPYTVTGDLRAALSHHLVIVPPDERPLRLSKVDLQDLSDFVSKGGTLVVQETGYAQWPELTGIVSVSPKRTRRRLEFEGSDPALVHLDKPEELSVPFSSPKIAEGIWTAGLTAEKPGSVSAAAVYPDTQETAVSVRTVGAGRVYVLGFDLRDVVLRPQAGRTFEPQRAQSNAFEPAADSWLLLLRGLYENAAPDWVRARSLPGDSSGLLLLSHSIESGDMLGAAQAWGQWERSRGVRSTWFAQTNHSDGGQDGPFYNTAFASVLRDFQSQGHEIAAHTVMHTEQFETLPNGTGLESRKEYRPETSAHGVVRGATLRGEIRVPKEMLEKDIPGLRVTGFRAPFFQFPEVLDDLLSAANYSWDSTLPAAWTLSHRPFFLTRRKTMSRSSRIVELPMTFDDETPTRVPAKKAPELLKTMRDVWSEEGTVVWQTRATSANRELETAVLDALPRGVALKTMGEAARWWEARGRARFWLEPGSDPKSRVLKIVLPKYVDASDLSFEVSGRVASCEASAGVTAACSGRIVRVVRAHGVQDASIELAFE